MSVSAGDQSRIATTSDATIATGAECAPTPSTSTSYSYQSLAGPRSIRLLRVVFFRGGKHFSLIEADIDSAPPYVAISYVWGDPAIKHHVALPSGTVGITESLQLALEDVLQALRKHAFGPSGGRDLWDEKTVHLWADALCINQRDTQEKNIQVPMTTAIYTKAAIVVTYMGPETQNSEGAIDLLRQLWKDTEMRSEQSREIRMLRNDYDLCELGLPPSHDPRWKALRQIFRSEWPSRVWIFQEFIVNENVALAWGSQFLPYWKCLLIVMLRCINKEFPSECVIDKDDVKSIHKQHGDIHTSNCLSTLLYLRGYYQPRKDKMTLGTLLRGCHRLKSSDPRDKVFALLGLATDRNVLGITADYGSLVTVKDVYTMTTVKIIQHEMSLDILSNVYTYRRYQAEDLPSWVVDWSGLPVLQQANMLEIDNAKQSPVFRACGSSPVQVTFNALYTEMTTTGMVVDKLISSEHFSPMNPAYSIMQHLSRMAYLVLQTGNHVYRTESGIITAFWHALTHGFSYNFDPTTLSYDCDFDIRMMCNSSYLTPLTDEHIFLARQFEMQSAETSGARPFGVTSKGYICVLQDGMEKGDMIAILRGGRVPFVLRPAGEGKYLILGEAYVQGLMKGEALSFGDLSEEITLV